MEEEAVKMQVPRPSFLGLGRAREHLIFFITAPEVLTQRDSATLWKALQRQHGSCDNLNEEVMGKDHTSQVRQWTCLFVSETGPGDHGS